MVQEPDKLEQAGQEIIALMKEKYSDLGIVFIVTGPVIHIKTENGQQQAGFEIINRSNMADGPTCAVLAEVLRGRIKDLPKFAALVKDVMIPNSGGSA